jgi:hypothetical protein
MKADIKLTITRLTPARIHGLLGVVLTGMSDNPHFPDPEVPLADMDALMNKLMDAMAMADDGSRLAKIERNVLVEQAKEMLRIQASYVRAKAHGDKLILSSSGFELQRERERLGVPEAPMLQVTPFGAAGMVKLRWNRVRGGKAFKIFIRKPDSTTFELHTVTTSASHVVQGLVSYQPYGFRVSAIGAAGEGLRSCECIAHAA